MQFLIPPPFSLFELYMTSLHGADAHLSRDKNITCYSYNITWGFNEKCIALHKNQCYDLGSLNISMRPSLFPYSIANQATKDKYAKRKQARLMRTALTRQENIHVVKDWYSEGRSSWRNLIKVMEINEVKNPVTTPAKVSHLQCLVLPLLENQEITISIALIGYPYII